MIRTSTAMAEEPLCPLIMKGHPIIFLELPVSCFLALGHKSLLVGAVSFEGALLGPLGFQAYLFNFCKPRLFVFLESETMETILLLPCVAALTRAV